MRDSTGVILLPTLNRIELLTEFVRSYIETKASSPLLILVDDADFNRHKEAYEEIASRNDQFRLINTGSNITMGDKCRFAYRYVKDHFPDKIWVGLLNDDHYCITPEWDKIVSEKFNGVGVELISTNDGFWNFGFQIVGLTAWKISLLDRAGIPIYPPGLDHLFIDNIWKAIGESTGVWRETMKVNIEHRHPFAGKMKQDETFNKSNSPQRYADEGKVFEEFMKNDFKLVCDKIMNGRGEALVDAKF